MVYIETKEATSSAATAATAATSTSTSTSTSPNASIEIIEEPTAHDSEEMDELVNSLSASLAVDSE